MRNPPSLHHTIPSSHTTPSHGNGNRTVTASRLHPSTKAIRKRAHLRYLTPQAKPQENKRTKAARHVLPRIPCFSEPGTHRPLEVERISAQSGARPEAISVANVNYRNATQRASGGHLPVSLPRTHYRIVQDTEYTHPTDRARNQTNMQTREEEDQKSGHACIQSKQQPALTHTERKPRRVVKKNPPDEQPAGDPNTRMDGCMGSIRQNRDGQTDKTK